MDTIHRVETYCRHEKYDLTGIGIPKTVDNDLFGTDHTPGFASAARSNILNVMQAGMLARDMQKVDKFVIYHLTSFMRPNFSLTVTSSLKRRMPA